MGCPFGAENRTSSADLHQDQRRIISGVRSPFQGSAMVVCRYPQGAALGYDRLPLWGEESDVKVPVSMNIQSPPNPHGPRYHPIASVPKPCGVAQTTSPTTSPFISANGAAHRSPGRRPGKYVSMPTQPDQEPCKGGLTHIRNLQSHAILQASHASWVTERDGNPSQNIIHSRPLHQRQRRVPS